MPWEDTQQLPPRLSHEKRQLEEQVTRWRMLCLDLDLVQQAIEGGFHILYMKPNPDKYEWMFNRIYMWACNRFEVWGIEKEGFIGEFYNTLTIAASYSAVVIGNGGEQYLMPRWRMS